MIFASLNKKRELELSLFKKQLKIFNPLGFKLNNIGKAASAGRLVADVAIIRKHGRDFLGRIYLGRIQSADKARE